MTSIDASMHCCWDATIPEFLWANTRLLGFYFMILIQKSMDSDCQCNIPT